MRLKLLLHTIAIYLTIFYTAFGTNEEFAPTAFEDKISLADLQGDWINTEEKGIIVKNKTAQFEPYQKTPLQIKETKEHFILNNRYVLHKNSKHLIWKSRIVDKKNAVLPHTDHCFLKKYVKEVKVDIVKEHLKGVWLNNLDAAQEGTVFEDDNTFQLYFIQNENRFPILETEDYFSYTNDQKNETYILPKDSKRLYWEILQTNEKEIQWKKVLISHPLTDFLKTTDKDNVDFAKHLIPPGENLNFKLKSRENPLNIALEKKFYEIAEFLLQKGADPYSFGNFPLETVVRNFGPVHLIQRMITKKEQLPLLFNLAIKYNNLEIIELLLAVTITKSDVLEMLRKVDINKIVGDFATNGYEEINKIILNILPDRD
jgi:hypothetical protein